MFSTVLKEFSGFLDKRFLAMIFAPSLAFWSLLVGLVTMTQGIATSLRLWERQPFAFQLFLIAIFLGWTLFFAYLLASLLTPLTKLFEGYWDDIWLLRWLGENRRNQRRAEFDFLEQERKRLIDRGKSIQQDLGAGSQISTVQHAKLHRELRQVEAERTAAYEKIYYHFPPTSRPEAIIPTRFGNIFKSTELYPDVHYGIDAVLLWPRLYHVLPTNVLESLGDAKSSMDFMLVVCTLSCVHAIAGGLIALIGGLNALVFLAVFAGSLLMCWLAYRGAIEAALSYGQIIRTAFDLHRRDLLASLGLDPPLDFMSERRLWSDINMWLFRGSPEKLS